MSTSTWSDGYVVDTVYSDVFVVDLNPAWLSMIAVLNGQPPIDLSQPIVWMDLGCGSGIAALTVAAANSGVTVWGCDFNPAHIERARSLARRAELDNCSFDEATFEAVAHDKSVGPAAVDVIIVNGVYSWVSSENQRHIAEIIRRRLKPGGLAFVMYEAATGWASMVPLAEAMRLEVTADGRRSDLAIRDAAAKLQALADNGAACFPIGARELEQFAQLSTANAFYAAHEYLGEHFHPIMSDVVHETLRGARCSYLASLGTTDHMIGWDPEWVRGLMTRASDTDERELMRDLVNQRALRRDLFRRGIATVSVHQHEEWLRGLSVVGLGRPFDPEVRIPVPLGEITIDPGLYGPIFAALDAGPLDADAVAALRPEWTLGDATAAICYLVAGGYAAPVRRGWQSDTAAGASTRRLNDVLVAENASGADHRGLSAPAIGGALTSEYVEMATIAALLDGSPEEVQELASFVTTELERQGRRVTEGNVLVQDPEHARTIVEQRVEGALTRFRSLRALGLQ